MLRRRKIRITQTYCREMCIYSEERVVCIYRKGTKQFVVTCNTCYTRVHMSLGSNMCPAAAPYAPTRRTSFTLKLIYIFIARLLSLATSDRGVVVVLWANASSAVIACVQHTLDDESFIHTRRCRAVVIAYVGCGWLISPCYPRNLTFQPYCV